MVIDYISSNKNKIIISKPKNSIFIYFRHPVPSCILQNEIDWYSFLNDNSASHLCYSIVQDTSTEPIHYLWSFHYSILSSIFYVFLSILGSSSAYNTLGYYGLPPIWNQLKLITELGQEDFY